MGPAPPPGFAGFFDAGDAEAATAAPADDEGESRSISGEGSGTDGRAATTAAAAAAAADRAGFAFAAADVASADLGAPLADLGAPLSIIKSTTRRTAMIEPPITLASTTGVGRFAVAASGMPVITPVAVVGALLCISGYAPAAAAAIKLGLDVGVDRPIP